MATISDINTDERFAQAILDGIRREVTAIAEEEADAAANRVHERVKARLNEISVRLLDHFSVERVGRDLRIIVKHEGTNA